ncbi:hypothetical protein E3U43_010598 [Larimichthys crocea]|uniref:Uncharacterized protein n=1 Tax=Larimichthys crocea TaxID=215358 RepID=A0ACD3RG11_LARCR|nr:hypothetical protein E3U43_010598 [Larimichthys crocea]
MDINKPRNSNQTSPSLKLSNGYILPEGKLTPNALFVGGIDTNVDENEMRDFFARYGTVKEVKIITYRGGICKGYGFVYFSEEVNIQTIVEQQISFKGRKLKLGPAIMKERSSRSMPSRLISPAPWMSPTQYFYCACCSPVGGGVAQPSPVPQWRKPLQSDVLLLQLWRGHDATDASELRTERLPLPVHSTSMDGGPEDTACQSELCGLWSPDYVDCAVVHNYSDTAYSESKCRQDDILMLWTAGSNPTSPPSSSSPPSPQFLRPILTPDCRSSSL